MSTTTFTSSAAVAPPRSRSRAIWLGFLVVLAASVMDLLDSTIAQTAAPAIRRDLGGWYAALEWISAAYTLAMAVTLMIGSRLGDLFGRRRVLLVGIGGYLPRTAPSAPGARLDAPSVALAMVGGFALVYPLIEGREHGWPAWSFALLGTGLIALAAFGTLQARRSRQRRTPLVEPSILRRRPYVAGLAVVLGFIGAMGGMMIALNVMFQTGLGLSPLACAVATVAIPVTAIGGSITSSALLAKIGRTTMHIGIVTMAIGLVVVDIVLRSDSGGVTAWDLAGPLAFPPTC